MTSEWGKAWTLVMSWATRNKGMVELQSTALSTDSPVNKNLPNWNKYRMSLSMMNDLSAQSTHWRVTCSFPTHGVDYVDYVRGKFADFDVVNFLGDNVREWRRQFWLLWRSKFKFPLYGLRKCENKLLVW